jgi:hypothetical protein
MRSIISQQVSSFRKAISDKVKLTQFLWKHDCQALFGFARLPRLRQAGECA